MKTLTIKDLTNTEELDHEAMEAVHGGMKKPLQPKVSIRELLTDASGNPVAVYVDDVLVNSVTTGYAPK